MTGTGLGALTSPEAGARSSTLVVPLGSLEQHGPHLPLDTDARIAVALARAVAVRRPEVVVAPVVAYGASGEHAGFPGTLSIGTEALTSVIVELVRSAGAELRRTVLVNGHGGNADAVRQATAVLTGEGRDVAAWSLAIPGGDAHAGRTETSLLLALCPEAVHLELAAAGATAPLAELLPRLRAVGVKGVSANGVLGDPTGASAEEGSALLAGLVDQLEAVLADVSHRGPRS